MCYYSFEKEGMTPRTAEEDIPCVKVLEHRRWSTYSPCQGTLYHWGGVKKCKVKSAINVHFLGYAQGIGIDKGIHCYTDGKAVDDLMGKYNFLHKAIIPKGATYYQNNIGEIVTNHLIVYRECTKY